MITGAVIPHGESRPLEIQPLGDLVAYQATVGGYIEVERVPQPRFGLVTNEEGRIHRLPVNWRATALWWLHERELFGTDVLVGDVCFLVSGDLALRENLPRNGSIYSSRHVCSASGSKPATVRPHGSRTRQSSTTTLRRHWSV